jgi:hypothetical protein
MDPRVKPAGDTRGTDPVAHSQGEPDAVSRVVMAEDQRGRDPC